MFKCRKAMLVPELAGTLEPVQTLSTPRIQERSQVVEPAGSATAAGLAEGTGADAATGAGSEEARAGAGFRDSYWPGNRRRLDNQGRIKTSGADMNYTRRRV